ncbi:MAG: outer membrane beta-barrel protein [Bacteroidetes bacterium]|nr:outer membrane beta-barrel protein [Bacteroidota bacterium]
MKYLFAFTFIIFTCNATIQAQNLSIDLYGGAMNYQGDLQDSRYTFNQSHFAGGAGLSYELSDHFSVRGALLLGKVSADDKYGRNKARNLNFASSITEAQLSLQYFITPIGAHSFTPYLFGGVALFHFNPYTFDTNGVKTYLRPLSTEGQGFISGKKNYNLTQINLPFGGGVKLSLSDNINVGLELGLRKLFTDYLDDVSTEYVDQAALLANRGSKAVELAYRGNELKNGAPYPAAGSIRGGAKNKDWYYFTGITLSFKLGNGRGASGGRNKQYGCPVNVR